MRAAALFCILVAGCSAHDDLALFELDRVEPAEVESGETLRVVGTGFALGRTPEIVLRGMAYRPGRAPLPIERALTGSVHSESLIEIAIDDSLIETVGGRATVDGTIWVGFRTDDDRRDIFSETRARIDFLPETSTTLRVEGGRPQNADGFGVRLSKEELGTVGVRVESVEAGGLAALQGVRPGDRLIGLDGMTLYSWRDFSPDPTTSESTVYAERQGLRGTHALRWPHAVTARPPEPWSVALFALLGLALGWVSPLTLLARRSPTAAPAPSSLVRGGLVVGLAAMLVVFPEVQSTTVWILALGVMAALSALVSRHRFEARSVAFALGGVLTVMMVSKTASIGAIVGAQEASALRWYAVQSPASTLAFVIYLHALALASSRPGLASSAYLSIAAVLGAALFLGGWQVGGPIGGAAVLAIKSAAILVGARFIAVHAKAAACCAALGLGLAVVGMFVDGTGLYPHWSSLAVGAALAVAVRALLPPLVRDPSPAIG